MSLRSQCSQIFSTVSWYPHQTPILNPYNPLPSGASALREAARGPCRKDKTWEITKRPGGNEETPHRWHHLLSSKEVEETLKLKTIQVNNHMSKNVIPDCRWVCIEIGRPPRQRPPFQDKNHRSTHLVTQVVHLLKGGSRRDRGTPGAGGQEATAGRIHRRPSAWDRLRLAGGRDGA